MEKTATESFTEESEITGTSEPLEETSGPSAREILLQLSDDIFMFLAEKNRQDRDFRFWLRQQDSPRSKEVRLENGQWFQGSGYIFVGFSNIGDRRNMTQSIGFVVTFDKTNKPSFHLEFVYPSEDREPVIACYREMVASIANHFEDSSSKSGRKHIFRYPQEDWQAALLECIEKDLPVIEGVAERFELDNVFKIPKGTFSRMLSRTQALRANLYPGESTAPNEQVNLQTESLHVEDRLGRQPFVDALKTYVERLWQEGKKDAYTIHLGGEWGSGKSKVLHMLKGDMEKDDWVIAEFNAWQNQHIDPPWWIFMDNVYKTIQQSQGHRPGTWWKERWWRLVRLNKLYWISFLGLVIVFALINIPSGFGWLNIGKLITDSQSGGKIISVITSYITILTSVWVLFKAITGSLIPASSVAANEFKQRSRDPMHELKKHYGEIIGYTKKNVGVFIDDIDRCNPHFVVKLLEGLQTLFKYEKVLYIVAGDGNWIKKSFEIYYRDLEDVINKPGNSVGNFFLEKTFQMSISVPTISDETKEMFWKYLLMGDEEKEEESELEEEIWEATSEEEIDQVLAKAATPGEKVALRSAAIQKLSENMAIFKDVEHKLYNYHKLLEPNPRSMKRLVNNYALERKSMILAGITLADVPDESLIQWIILKSRFPLIADELIANPGKSVDEIDFQGSSEEFDRVVRGLSPDVITACIRR